MQALLDDRREDRCNPADCEARIMEHRADGELCGSCPQRRSPRPTISAVTQRILRMKRLRDGGYFSARTDARDLMTLAEWEALGIVSEMLSPRL